METHFFIINPQVTADKVSETIFQHLAKAKAVTSCLLSMRESTELAKPMVYDAIWTVDDYLDELLLFHAKLNELVG